MPSSKEVSVFVRLSEAERRKLKAKTALEGTSIQALLYFCVHEYLSRKGKAKRQGRRREQGELGEVATRKGRLG